MANISQPVFESVEIIANALAETFKYDKMIVGIVKDLKNKDIGEYVVEYEGNDLIAYSQDPINQVFENDEIVYVRIPEGDFSKSKIIEKKSSSISQIHNPFELRETNSVSLKINNQDSYTFENIAAAANSVALSGLPIDISNNAQYFRLSAEFKFEEPGGTITKAGNYGVRLIFKDKQEEPQYYECTLDMDNFTGWPYGYLDWSPQYVDLTLPRDFIETLESGEFFYKEFDKNEKLSQNISVRNIKLTSYDLVDLTQIDNYFTLSSSLIGPSRFNLKVDLKSFGRSMLSKSNSKIKWYKVEEVLEKNEETEEEYLVLKDTLLTSTWINPYEVRGTGLYKVEAEYKDTIYQEYISVGYSNKIIQITENNSVYLKIEDKNAKWYFKGKLIPDAAQQLNISSLDLGVSNVFICVSEGKYYYYKVNNSSEKLEIAFKGSDSFTYDENGQLSARETEKVYTLKPDIKWPEGYAFNYVSIWKIGDIEITKKGVSPENSMFESLWCDSSYLYFKIKKEYNNELSNNKIKLIIKSSNNSSFEYEKEITFTKNGSPTLVSPKPHLVVEPLITYNSKLELTYTENGLIKFYDDGEFVNSAHLTYQIKGNATISDNLITINSNDYIGAICQITAEYENQKYVYNAPIIWINASYKESKYDIPQYIQYDKNRSNPKYTTTELSFEKATKFKYKDSFITSLNKETISPTIDSLSTVDSIKVYKDNELIAVFPVVIEVENEVSQYEGSSTEVNEEASFIGTQAGDYDEKTGEGILLGYNEKTNKYEINAFSNHISTFCLDSSGNVNIKKLEKDSDQHSIEVGELWSNRINTFEGLRFREKTVEKNENGEEIISFKSSPASIILDTNNALKISNESGGIDLNSQTGIKLNSPNSIILESSTQNARISVSKNNRIYLSCRENEADFGGIQIYVSKDKVLINDVEKEEWRTHIKGCGGLPLVIDQ